MHISYHTETGPALVDVIPPKIRQAAAKALTGVAFDTRDSLVEGMRSAFDKPNAFTLNAFKVRAATPNELEAVVWAMPRQARYLFWEIEGGDRASKAFEHKLGLFGGKVAVPVGAAAAQFEGSPFGFVKRMLADLNTSGTSKRFFIGAPKGRPGQDGVWARVGKNNRIVRVMDFAQNATYKERFHASAIADQTVNAKWESQLLKHLRAGGME